MTTQTTNLSWGTLTAVSIDAAKFWLRFIAGVWMNATHGSEEVEDVYQATIATIDAMEGRIYDDPSDGEVYRVHEAFVTFALALRSLDHNPVNVTCQLDNEHGKKLRLGWNGAWTRGRYVKVSYEPRNYPTVFVQWNTGTGEESTFLSLPSTVEQYVEGDPDAKVYPLVNHYRIACEDLGIDVSDILELGYDGVRKAQQALEDLVENAIRTAEKKVTDQGGRAYE